MTQQMETGRVTMMRMLERRVRMRAQHPGEVAAAGIIYNFKKNRKW